MTDVAQTLARASRQQQFLDVIDVAEARARLRAHLDPRPRGTETVALGEALNRVLAQDVVAAVDVPGFDRASVDGFALRAADTAGASEAAPCRLRLNAELVTPGRVPALTVAPGTATLVATGGMLPRGADAVVMVEHTEPCPPAPDGGHRIELRRPIAPGAALGRRRRRHRPRRDLAAGRDGGDLARDRHARGGGPCAGRRVAPPERRRDLDR